MALPPLVHDFRHAVIKGATIGPRREVTLAISLLAWRGLDGTHEDDIRVRFGGIENFAEVAAFFGDPNHQGWLELADLRYATTEPSRPDKLRFDLIAERIDAHLVVRCGRLQVGSVPGQPGRGASGTDHGG